MIGLDRQSSSKPCAASVQLGTVSFGRPYGLRRETLPRQTSFRVLDEAWEIGIRTLDTAQAYGVAESVVGDWAASRSVQPEFVSKFSSLAGLDSRQAVERVTVAIEATRRHLRRPCIDVYLAHDVQDMHRAEILDCLLEAQNAGWIGTIGASVYKPEETLELLNSGRGRAIQAPVSVFDSRQADEGAVKRCRDSDARFVGRSLYLQGTLGLSADELPDHLSALRAPLTAFNRIAARMDVTPFALALAYPRLVYGVDECVIGAVDPVHLAAVTESLDITAIDAEAADDLWTQSRRLPADAIDPRRWPAMSP